ncbi:MAG TPA: SIMPL domain-containing protein [Stellaceae bacterium]|nr:SIMPL domain-containing protein [Stellaceae bacterium]
MKRFVVSLALMLAPAPALAQAPAAPLPESATLLHLGEPAQRFVTRDQLRAVLRVEAVDADAAKLQADINRRLAASVAKAKSVTTLRVETSGYSVYPELGPSVVSKARTNQWHGSASLSLIGQDAAPLLGLVGELQKEGLVLSSLAYELTPAAARAVEMELTDEALAHLKDRAAKIAATLGLSVERIRDLRVGNALGTQPVPRIFAQQMAAASAPAPVAEPGEATVTVTVDADIVLVPKR